MADPRRIERVKRKYRFNAPLYDAIVSLPTLRLRRRAVQRLALKPGDTVLDFGCGSGLSFKYLEQALGPEGRIVGVELSPEMLARARDKMKRHGWSNITLIEGNAEEVDLPGPVDRVLCFYTHDIMNSPPAVERALGALRPEGLFVAAGIKRAKGVRGIPINLYTLAYSLPFITIKAAATLLWGTAVPWSYLESVMGHLDVEEHLGGSAYLACGVKGTN